MGEGKQYNPFLRIVCDDSFVHDNQDMMAVVDNALALQHQLLQVTFNTFIASDHDFYSFCNMHALAQ